MSVSEIDVGDEKFNDISLISQVFLSIKNEKEEDFQMKLNKIGDLNFAEYLTNFVLGFMEIEFSFVHMPHRHGEDPGTFYDEGFSFKDLSEKSQRQIIEECLNFIVENRQTILELDRLTEDAHFCGQGFSLGRRNDEFCFMVGPDGRDKSRLLFESAKNWPVYDYDISVNGIEIDG